MVKIKFPIIAQDRFSKAMTKLSQSLGQIQSKISQSSAKAKKALDISAKAGQAGQALSGARDAAVGIFDSIISEGRQFEKTMSKVGAVSGASKEELKELSHIARKFGSETSFSAAEAAQGMVYMSMAGIKGKEAMEAATKAALDLAKAGDVELGRSADVVSDIMSQYAGSMANAGVEQNKMAEHVANVMTKAFTSANVSVETLYESFKYVGPVADKLGVSIEESATALALLGNVGIKGSSAGTALAGALARLAAPSDKAAGSLADLGVSTKDQNGNLRGFTDVIADLSDAMDKKGLGSAEKMEYITNIFGKEASRMSGMAELLAKGGDGIRNFAAEMEKGATAAQVAEQMSQNFDGAMTQMDSALAELKLIVFTELATHLTDLTNLVKKVFTWIGAFAKENPKLTTTLAVVAATITGVLVVLTPLMFMISTISAGIAALTPILAALSAGFAIFKTVLIAGFAILKGGFAMIMANPIGILVAAVVGLVAWFVVAYKKAGSFTGAIKLMWEQVKNAVAWVGKLFGFGGGSKKTINVNQASAKANSPAPVIGSGMGGKNQTINKTTTEKSIVELKLPPGAQMSKVSGSGRGIIMGASR